MYEVPDIVQFPGEPDILAEVRLRAELRALHHVATMAGRVDFMREAFYRKWPGVYEATEILAPPDHKALIAEHERLRFPLRIRLLDVEAHFVNKGWKLPKWTRPRWLLELEE